MQEELKKKDEDDEYRNDTDPKGYENYKKIVKIFGNHSFIVRESLKEGL